MKSLFLILLICLPALTFATQKKIVCYLGSWSVYRTGNGKFDIQNIDPKLCTHYIYAFAKIQNDDLEVNDKWCDLADGGGLNNFAKFTDLRRGNPNAKFMIAVGGWNLGSTPFSDIACDPKRREVFAKNAVKFLKKYNFDGLDIDWEYPAQRGGRSSDVNDYVKFVAALNKAFQKDGLLLSAAVAACQSSASKSYDIAGMSEYFDFINLMAYDLHGSWESKTGLNGQLSPSSKDSGDSRQMNVKSAVEYWLSKGCPPEKLVLGVPTYGRSYNLQDPNNNGLGAPASGAGQAGPYTQEPGNLGYNEICEMQKQGDWTVKHDDECGGAYAYKGNQWVGYDDVETVKTKAKFVLEKNLGGAMIWALETDDFNGVCGEKFPIVKALNSVLGSDEPTKFDLPIEKEDEDIADDSGLTGLAPSNDASDDSLALVPFTGVCDYEGQLLKNPENCNYFMCEALRVGFFKQPMHCPPPLCFDERNNACNYK